MKIHWTNTAQDHLKSIHDYVAVSSCECAKRIVDRLTRRTIQIRDFPYSGRIIPEYESDQVREIIEGPYRILYCIQSDRIEILAVIHSARNVLRDQIHI